MQTLVIYGNSLVASSIGASLQGCPDLQVLLVDPALPDAGGCLVAPQPDIILFDLATVESDFAIALWKAQPRLLLIGVDLKTDQALVLSSQPARLLTTEDLLQLITGHPGPAGISKGK